MDEQSQLSEIAATLKGDEINSSNTSSNATSDEKNMSMARKVMNIIAREDKSSKKS